MNIIKRPAELTPHIIIITSFMFLTFFVTDRFNGSMNFIAHDLTENLFIASAAIFVYQAAVFVWDFGRNKKQAVFTAITLLATVVSIYLAVLCIIDQNSNASRLMLKEINKFALLAYTLLSLVSSVRMIVSQRAYKTECNRDAQMAET